MGRRGGRGRGPGSAGGQARRRPAPPRERRLSLAEAQFYARVYDPARKGSLAELRRRGCDEHEAEELFAAAYAKVMEAVDPIEREFSAPQMVRFVKRACWRRLVDERRQRAQRAESAAGPPRLRPESPAEPPSELAEEREAVAIGREALAMLPERDRLLFTRRHLEGMEPEEIVAQTPGLSLRTYRKVIQRANARVLEAYGRIEAGERCAEMESTLLRRYVAGEGLASERTAVEAHLTHCRACQQAQVRMRDYLIDVASGTLLVSSLGGGGAVPAHLLELVSQGAQALGEASRAVRERGREALLRLAALCPVPAPTPVSLRPLAPLRGASSRPARRASPPEPAWRPGLCRASAVSARSTATRRLPQRGRLMRRPPRRPARGNTRHLCRRRPARQGRTPKPPRSEPPRRSAKPPRPRAKSPPPLPTPQGSRSAPSSGLSRASLPLRAVPPRPLRAPRRAPRSPAPRRRRAAARAPAEAQRVRAAPVRSSASERRTAHRCSHTVTVAVSHSTKILSARGGARRLSYV